MSPPAGGTERVSAAIAPLVRGADGAGAPSCPAATFSGFAANPWLDSAAMFEPIRAQIETAAGKTAQLRRFL
jgi:hypothetical protein